MWFRWLMVILGEEETDYSSLWEDILTVGE
jgi:hypothetical protein